MVNNRENRSIRPGSGPHTAPSGISYSTGQATDKTSIDTIPARGDIRELKWIEQVIGLMDNRFRVPGTNIRFGLDPIIGFVPFLGEAVSFGISGILVLAMVKYGASRKVVIKMVGNVLLDSVIGSIPLIGDLFDFAYKANQRNLKLLKEHQLEGKHSGSGRGILVGAALALFMLMGLVLYGIWNLGEWIVSLF